MALVAPAGWARFLQLNRERPADWDSLWFYAQEVRGAIFDVGLLNVVTLLLFAGGSGITPVMSLIKSTLKYEPGSRFTLLYGNRDSNSLVSRPVPQPASITCSLPVTSSRDRTRRPHAVCGSATLW